MKGPTVYATQRPTLGPTLGPTFDPTQLPTLGTGNKNNLKISVGTLIAKVIVSLFLLTCCIYLLYIRRVRVKEALDLLLSSESRIGA